MEMWRGFGHLTSSSSATAGESELYFTLNYLSRRSNTKADHSLNPQLSQYNGQRLAASLDQSPPGSFLGETSGGASPAPTLSLLVSLVHSR
jgi:hypothetical protein